MVVGRSALLALALAGAAWLPWDVSIPAAVAVLLLVAGCAPMALLPWQPTSDVALRSIVRIAPMAQAG